MQSTMGELTIEQLPAPAACGLCGRPTTRYALELDMAFCGREERPADWVGRTGDFAPVMRGGGRRRRFRSSGE